MAKTIISILVLLFVFPAIHAVPYTVGNSHGWSINVHYTTWARSLNFVVGDSLVFNYGPGHSVAEVSAANYKSCNATNPISLYTTGPTTITLDAAVADRYFICGAPHHCDFGQKIAINVKGGSVPSKPANTPPPTSSPSAAGCLGSSQIVLSLVLADTFGVI